MLRRLPVAIKRLADPRMAPLWTARAAHRCRRYLNMLLSHFRRGISEH